MAFACHCNNRYNTIQNSFNSSVDRQTATYSFEVLVQRHGLIS